MGIAAYSEEKWECGFIDGAGGVGGAASIGRAVGRGDMLVGDGLGRGDVGAVGGRAAALTDGGRGRAEALTRGGGRPETLGCEDKFTGAGRTDWARAGNAGGDELLLTVAADTE